MQYRELGRTGWKVSTVSFGAWAIGGAWGSVDDKESLAALDRAVDLGVNFIDTADVYGDGRSERLVSELRRRRSEEIHVATKAGRRLNPHTNEGYNRKNLTAFVERSLQNLGTEAIDLLQLHCPPKEVYYRPEVFGVLDDLVAAGQAAVLRREREIARGRTQGDGLSEPAERADHFQHVSPSAGGVVFCARRSGGGSAFWPGCRWRPAC